MCSHTTSDKTYNIIIIIIMNRVSSYTTSFTFRATSSYIYTAAAAAANNITHG